MHTDNNTDQMGKQPSKQDMHKYVFDQKWGATAIDYESGYIAHQNHKANAYVFSFNATIVHVN